ncbi:hypothetical protein F4825DRAFT_13458 [Nemania diffusa]|nr:hypothetical protein F4825DRAFT_13458 [Nemania diffusa]
MGRKYQRLANMLESCTTKEAGKSKAFLREFRKDVKKKDAELNIFREKKEQEFTKGQEKIATIFKQLSQQFPDGRDGRFSTLRKEDHPLFNLARVTKEDHQSLLKQFKLVEEQLDADKLELPMAQWKQDKQDIREFLGHSGRYGEALVGSLLAPESPASPVFDQANASEEGQFAKELFKDSRELMGGETWGQVAEDQLKHFSAIARMVQLEEEG